MIKKYAVCCGCLSLKSYNALSLYLLRNPSLFSIFCISFRLNAYILLSEKYRTGAVAINISFVIQSVIIGGKHPNFKKPLGRLVNSFLPSNKSIPPEWQPINSPSQRPEAKSPLLLAPSHYVISWQGMRCFKSEGRINLHLRNCSKLAWRW